MAWEPAVGPAPHQTALRLPALTARMGDLGAGRTPGRRPPPNPLARPQVHTGATAAQYHLIHAVVVMILALSANNDGMPLGPWPVIGFTGGVVLFSFSLYAYVLTGIAMFAMVTPLGGTLLIMSWLLLIYRGVK